MTSETKNCLSNLLLAAGLVGEVALNVHVDREVPDNEITTARLAPTSSKRELSRLFLRSIVPLAISRRRCASHPRRVRFNPEGKGAGRLFHERPCQSRNSRSSDDHSHSGEGYPLGRLRYASSTLFGIPPASRRKRSRSIR